MRYHVSGLLSLKFCFSGEIEKSAATIIERLHLPSSLNYRVLGRPESMTRDFSRYKKRLDSTRVIGTKSFSSSTSTLSSSTTTFSGRATQAAALASPVRLLMSTTNALRLGV